MASAAHELMLPGLFRYQTGTEFGRQWCYCPSHSFLYPLLLFQSDQALQSSLPACSQENFCHSSSCGSCFSNWKSFSLTPCLWSAKKEPSCSAFHCWFLWEGLQKPQVGCLSFLWGKRSSFNGSKKKKKEKQLGTFLCSLALCELKNLRILRLTVFWLSTVSQVSEQQRECLCLLLFAELHMRQSPYFRLLISLQRQCNLLLSTLRRDLIMPFKKSFLPNQARWEWPMSSIFVPCFIAQTSDHSCCNPVCKMCLEGTKTKQKSWVFFFTACRSKDLHAVLSPQSKCLCYVNSQQLRL